jgi:hypothetical protein
MKYETLVMMHKYEYQWWHIGGWGFEAKKEYTVFDFLWFLPATVLTLIGMRIERLWNRRKKWVLASNVPKETRTEEKQ